MGIRVSCCLLNADNYLQCTHIEWKPLGNGVIVRQGENDRGGDIEVLHIYVFYFIKEGILKHKFRRSACPKEILILSKPKTLGERATEHRFTAMQRNMVSFFYVQSSYLACSHCNLVIQRTRAFISLTNTI